jgi:CHAT domain-containing protein
VLQTHTIAVEPSATVFDLLHNRLVKHAEVTLPYIGVAAWTQTTDDRNFIVRAIAGPERSQLVPLPSSQHEVETIAGDLPRPSQILLGSNATESTFKHLALNSTDVIHLALHGFVDVDYRLALPVAAYISAKGTQIDGKGITPDIDVPWSFNDAIANRDNQLAAAIEVFHSAKTT